MVVELPANITTTLGDCRIQLKKHQTKRERNSTVVGIHFHLSRCQLVHFCGFLAVGFGGPSHFYLAKGPTSGPPVHSPAENEQ